MPDQKIYHAPELDMQHLCQMLSEWLQAQGYETQTLTTPGGYTVQARQTRSWVQRHGVAVNTMLVKQGENVQVRVGTGKWAVHAVSGVAAAILFWPLLAIPAYVAFKQKEILDEVWQYVDAYVASGGEATPPGVLPQAFAPAPAPAASAEVPCPSCGEAVREGAKFCDNCGAKLTLTCAECGATLRLDAKFCDGCGTAVES